MKTTVKRGTALARGHMRKVSTRSSNISPPWRGAGVGGGVGGIYSPVWPKPVQMPSICRKLFECVILPASPDAGEIPESRRSGVVTSPRPRGGWRLPRERPQQMSIGKNCFCLCTQGWGIASVTRVLAGGPRLVYVDSRITALIKRSGREWMPPPPVHLEGRSFLSRFMTFAPTQPPPLPLHSPV